MKIKSQKSLIKKGFFLVSLSIMLLSSEGFISSLKAETAITKATPMLIANVPLTTMTQKNANIIAVEIKDAEFRFKGNLKRTSGNTFIGEDRQVRVIYDKGTSHLVVINKITGTEFYNYIFSIADEGQL